MSVSALGCGSIFLLFFGLSAFALVDYLPLALIGLVLVGGLFLDLQSARAIRTDVSPAPVTAVAAAPPITETPSK